MTNNSQTPLLVEEEANFKTCKSGKNKNMVTGPNVGQNQDELCW